MAEIQVIATSCFCSFLLLLLLVTTCPREHKASPGHQACSTRNYLQLVTALEQELWWRPRRQEVKQEVEEQDHKFSGVQREMVRRVERELAGL